MANNKNDKPTPRGSRRPAPPARKGRGAPAAKRPTAPGTGGASGAGADERTRINSVAEAPGARKPAPRKRKNQVRGGSVAKQVFFNFLKAMFVLMCLVALVLGVLAVQVIQYVVVETADDDVDLDLENYKLSQTSYIMVMNPEVSPDEARETNNYIKYQELTADAHRIWVPLDQMPQHMRDAVIATEDRNFETHHGVDWPRTVKALLNEVIPSSGDDDSFGASTIHQQLVKNLTGETQVEDEHGDRTVGYLRKMREIFSAWGLANRYSKDMVMEAYLNTIGLSEQIAGVQAGAHEYFGKEAKDLTLAECATIAGITQSPTKYSPFQNPENCLKRRNDVLTFMRDTDKITEAEYQEAVELPLGLNPPKESGGSNDTFSYVSDVVYEEVVRDMMDQKGLSYAAAQNRLRTGGYKIYATAELRVQSTLERMYLHGYEEYNAETGAGYFLNPNRFPGYQRSLGYIETDPETGEQRQVLPQSSAVVIDYEGRLIGVAGGIGQKTASLTYNRAVNSVGPDGKPQGVRQVGSTMKMTAAYPLAMENGMIHNGSARKDVPALHVPGSTTKADPATGFNWPRNYEGNWSGNTVTISNAIARSLNTVAAGVGKAVGEEEMYDFLVNTLEVSTLDEKEDMGLSSLVLGGMYNGISPYELAGCYMMYGNGGKFFSLHSYERVEDAQGNLYMEPKVTQVQAISESTSYMLRQTLSGVLRSGGGTAYGMAPAGEMDSVGKTGTASDDTDRTYVGLTPYYVTAVWWGYDENTQQHNFATHYWSPGARTNIPVNVWKSLMEEVQTGLAVKEFPAKPESVQMATVCNISGDRAGTYCRSTTYTEVAGNGPTKTCTTCTAQTNQEDDEKAAQDAENAEGGADGEGAGDD